MSIFNKLGSFFAADGSGQDQVKTQTIDAEKLAAAALMVEVATQDGEFDDKERNVIESILTGKLKLSSEDAKELLHLAEDKQSQSIQILSFTKEIKNHFDDEGRAHIMEMLWGVVFADGEEDVYESNLMRRIAGLLYISDKQSGEIRKKVKQENNIL
ncbi:TerB family tellurite resistance protein [Pseudemcibacter aquimaris]|uniref:tellurite resistance TerB family protein n=1 Tax=Pseudemcibacter aquimaris TaxID=2857064 RepID=UPI0020115710|nr:TerB family tellurite resistance protein [Pseudemcibacter aquimaris]MCC3861591.1 TerB family tellurite resistance protein [Pseudemcibacter aquimaris]WDU58360.1 TerB family tellurite resistance protein [Pseudemcibacter aquimaris]